MSPGALPRMPGRRPAPPVRMAHLGLGSFFRAHQAWYTAHAPDAERWGIAAFAGRDGRRLVEELDAQDGRYTLVSRGAVADRFEVVGSLARAYTGTDHDAWLAVLSSPAVAVVTMTVTEAGYHCGVDGNLDLDDPEVTADLAALRLDPRGPVRTAPGRLVAGLAARRRADAGPVTLVPCDNLPANGATVARVVRRLAERLEPALAAWTEDTVSVVSTVVDRITPRPAPGDRKAVADATGVADACPVVTEPFAQWVLAGDFPAGRPDWEAAGAELTDDVTPHQARKLWLLNGGHSLLAYAGSVRGHGTVAEAVTDDTCRTWLEAWWSEAAPHVDLPSGSLTAYRVALLERFANPRIGHRLDQITPDGSKKLPARVVPVLVAERRAGRLPTGAARVLAAWICHLRGRGVPVADVGAGVLVPLAAGAVPDAVRSILGALHPPLAEDGPLRALVAGQVAELLG